MTTFFGNYSLLTSVWDGGKWRENSDLKRGGKWRENSGKESGNSGEFAQAHEYLGSLIYLNPFNKKENGHNIFLKKLFFLTNNKEKWTLVTETFISSQLIFGRSFGCPMIFCTPSLKNEIVKFHFTVTQVSYISLGVL